MIIKGLFLYKWPFMPFSRPVSGGKPSGASFQMAVLASRSSADSSSYAFGSSSLVSCKPSTSKLTVELSLGGLEAEEGVVEAAFHIRKLPLTLPVATVIFQLKKVLGHDRLRRLAPPPPTHVATLSLTCNYYTSTIIYAQYEHFITCSVTYNIL